MNQPTTQEIRERHDRDGSFPTDFLLTHKDRGILLDRLEAAETKLVGLIPYSRHDNWCDVNYLYASGNKPCNCGYKAILESK